MAGFSTDQKKKVNRQRTSSKSLKGYVLGDVLVGLGKAIRKLGFPVEEVERVVPGLMGAVSIPFVHYTSSDGTEIPYGNYRLEGFGVVEPSFGGEDGDDPIPELTISVNYETGADETLWGKLIDLIHAEMREHISMFRHKAIRITSPKDMIIPHLIDTTSPPDLFLDEGVMEDIETNLLYPIQHSVELKDLGVKLQRGILLTGKYGTGKSLIAYLAAQESVKVGRTFILCRMDMLSAAIPVSRFLQPSTLFIEDMDEMRHVAGGLSEIRNMLSGVENKKGFDVITVLTTNFLDQVIKTDRSLLRPERIDAVIEIKSPTAPTVQRLVEWAAKGWLKGDEDWERAYKAIAAKETTPAIIIEMLNRAKMEAKRKGGLITLPMLERHFDAMERQIELSEPALPEPLTPSRQMGEALYAVTRGNL